MESVLSDSRIVRFVVACALMFTMGGGWSDALLAQDRSKHISVDIGTGFFNGIGGGRRATRDGFIAVAQVSGRAYSRGSTSILLALNISGFAILDNSDNCVVEIPTGGAPTGGCLPDFPSGAATGALLGVEQQFGGKVVARLLAGPAIFDTNGPPSRTGVQTRFDVTMPVKSVVAFQFWAQNGFMPITNYPRAHVRAFGLGMRIQKPQ